jgi:hypothetical protein
LKPLYDQFARESVLNVKAEQVATFLGHKITPQLAQEVGSQFSTRIEGTCIKHRFGSASVKMYDKFGCVLRIETTTNDVSFLPPRRRKWKLGRFLPATATTLGSDAPATIAMFPCSAGGRFLVPA